MIDMSIHPNQILNTDIVFLRNRLKRVVSLYNVDFHKSDSPLYIISLQYMMRFSRI